MKTDFRSYLENNLIAFDGAMGTMLYSRGIYINQCYEELNLTNPLLVQQIHRDYLAAGAKVLETNTFGANRFKLKPNGLVSKVGAINYQGAKLAQEVAGDKAYVAGSIGPLGIRIEPWGKTSVEEAEEAFTEQARALHEAGVDLFILETFYDINEIHQAIKAIKKVSDKPIIASMTINEEGNVLFGTTPEVFTTKLDEWGADVIGLNCSVGPKAMFDAMEKVREFTRKPLIAQPNAGMPKVIDGRTIYLCNPEYFGEYAKRFVQLGVRALGGCCGTTPEHIRYMSNAILAQSGSHQKFFSLSLQKDAKELTTPENIQLIPPAEKSQFSRKMISKEFVVCAELAPPKGCDPHKIIEAARALKGMAIDAINIPDSPRASARMSPLSLAILVEQQVGIETILHYCCRDRNILGIQSDVLGAWAVGLHNILCITGDPPKVGNYPEATAVFDIDSIGLTNVVYRLNHGLDLGGNPIGKPTGFFIGVGANPGAIDLDLEVRRFKWKVDAGAEFAITQPVFDISLLQRFLDRIKDFRIPIIAGIWPLASLKNAEFLNNEVPGASVPDPIMKRLREAGTPEAQREEGIRIAQEALRAIRPLVEGVQISVPFGRTEFVVRVLEALS